METKTIYKALAAINKEIKAISKEKVNKQQGFKFRGIDDVMNELHDLFAKNDVIIVPSVKSRNCTERESKAGGALYHTTVDIEYSFIASDGSSITASAIGEAMDSGDKGTTKCMSVALKMILFEMFLIPTEEMKDPDSESHEVKKSKHELVAEVVLKPIPNEKYTGLVNYVNNNDKKKAMDMLKHTKEIFSLTEDQENEVLILIADKK